MLISRKRLGWAQLESAIWYFTCLSSGDIDVNLSRLVISCTSEKLQLFVLNWLHIRDQGASNISSNHPRNMARSGAQLWVQISEIMQWRGINTGGSVIAQQWWYHTTGCWSNCPCREEVWTQSGSRERRWLHRSGAVASAWGASVQMEEAEGLSLPIEGMHWLKGYGWMWADIEAWGKVKY